MKKVAKRDGLRAASKDLRKVQKMVEQMAELKAVCLDNERDFLRVASKALRMDVYWADKRVETKAAW